MIRTLLASVAVIALTTPAVLACGDMAICVTADPNSTAVSLVSAPSEGDVVATVDNGVEIEVVDYMTAGGAEWVQVSLSGPSWGYVEKSALVCDASDDYSEICTIDTESGSLSVMEEPNGYVYGDLGDGIKVRPYDQMDVDGVTWVAIERFGSDNAVGWMLDAMMNCDGEHEHDL